MYGIAHDLCNPLNGILGCELADYENPSLDPEQKIFIADIQDCGEPMLALTQSLLDVARIEEFHGEIELETVDCNAAIHKIAAEFGNAAQQKKIAIDLDLDSDDACQTTSLRCSKNLHAYPQSPPATNHPQGPAFI